MSERERFEVWTKTEWPELKGTRFPEGYGDFSGKYLSDKMQHAWEGWQAALADHAKVCAGVWVPLKERLPDFDGGRVVIHTEGVDFAGEQYFHIYSDALHEEGASEVARAATHWLDVEIATRLMEFGDGD